MIALSIYIANSKSINHKIFEVKKNVSGRRKKKENERRNKSRLEREATNRTYVEAV